MQLRKPTCFTLHAFSHASPKCARLLRMQQNELSTVVNYYVQASPCYNLNPNHLINQITKKISINIIFPRDAP